jgi:hypothetical protein
MRVSNPLFPDRMASQIGHPTVVINNAGVVQGKLITELTPEDVRQYGSCYPLEDWKEFIFHQDLRRQRSRSLLDAQGIPPRDDQAESRTHCGSPVLECKLCLKAAYRSPSAPLWV